MTNNEYPTPNRTVFKTCIWLSVIGTASLYSLGASAGAWVPEEGKGYAKIGYANYKSTSFRGNRPDFAEFKGNNISYYAEHGLGDNWAIFGQLLYQDLEQTTTAGVVSDASGFGDSEIGLRYQWQAEPFVFSTSFLAKLPYLYDEDDAFALGNGQEDFEVKFLLGKSLHPFGYIGIEGGYRYRTDSPSDEYRYLIEYGFDFNEHWYFRTKLDGIASANNADESTNNGAGDNLAITQEFDSGKLELTTGWTFEKERNGAQWGVELTFSREIYGDNILEGNSWQLAITRVY